MFLLLVGRGGGGIDLISKDTTIVIIDLVSSVALMVGSVDEIYERAEFNDTDIVFLSMTIASEGSLMLDPHLRPNNRMRLWSLITLPCLLSPLCANQVTKALFKADGLSLSDQLVFFRPCSCTTVRRFLESSIPALVRSCRLLFAL